MRYWRVVIILFSTSLYKPTFCTYSFGKTRVSSFCVLVFRISVSLVCRFQLFSSTFRIQCPLKRLNNICIINSSQLIQQLYKKTCFQRGFEFTKKNVLCTEKFIYKKTVTKVKLQKFKKHNHRSGTGDSMHCPLEIPHLSFSTCDRQ